MAKKATTGGLNPLPTFLRASARDAGDRSMRAAGRRQWNDDDWNAMVAEQDRLIDSLYGEGPLGRVKLGFADAMHKAGLLSISTKDFWGELNAAWEAHLAAF